MKKFTLLLALILLMCLCGCRRQGNAESAKKTDAQDQTAITAQTAAENPAAKYVGTWFYNGNIDYAFIRLLPSGNAAAGTHYEDASFAKSGRWELDDERIFVFFDRPVYVNEYGSFWDDDLIGHNVLIFQIKDENCLQYDSHYYKRVD